MADHIASRNVKIKKARRCLTCCRKSEAGTEMNVQVNTEEGQAYSIYLCLTCKQLIASHFKFITGGESEFHEGDVAGILESKHCNCADPEELLRKLDNKEEVIH